jgi:hypothetical protein
VTTIQLQASLSPTICEFVLMTPVRLNVVCNMFLFLSRRTLLLVFVSFFVISAEKRFAYKKYRWCFLLLATKKKAVVDEMTVIRQTHGAKRKGVLTSVAAVMSESVTCLSKIHFFENAHIAMTALIQVSILGYSHNLFFSVTKVFIGSSIYS